MSNYKTPIRIHVGTTRKVNERVGKYRLPFRKDESNQQRVYSLRMNQNQPLMISSELPKCKESASLNHLVVVKPGLQSETQLEMSAPKSIKASASKSIKQEVCKQNSKDDFEEEMDGNYIDTESVSDRQGREGEISLRRPREKKMLYETPAVKIFRYSSLAKYDQGDQSQLVDPSRRIRTEGNAQKGQVLKERTERVRTEGNEQKGQVLKERKERKQKKDKKGRNDNEDPLPALVLNKVQSRRLPPASAKKQYTKLWSSLSKQIEEHRQNSLIEEHRQNSLNGKLKRPKKIRSSNKLTKSSKEDNNCLSIESQLKLMSRRRQQKLQVSLSKEEPYRQMKTMKTIPEEEAQSSSKLRQRQNSFVYKLKQAIDKQQDGKPSKLRYPLEHYIENYYKIKQINPFFRKLNELAGCIMLSIGKLKIVERGFSIYEEAQPLNYIYVVIVGKLLLSNSNKSCQKFALTGETLGEELLFEGGKAYHERLASGVKSMLHREEARSLSRVCLLSIKPQKYYKISAELGSIGYKGLFNLIDNLFRINYFKKTASFHGRTRGRLQSQAFLNHRKKLSYS